MTLERKDRNSLSTDSGIYNRTPKEGGVMPKKRTGFDFFSYLN